jgi:hypothetical protein
MILNTPILCITFVPETYKWLIYWQGNFQGNEAKTAKNEY